jgi:hypothetical protein
MGCPPCHSFAVIFPGRPHRHNGFYHFFKKVTKRGGTFFRAVRQYKQRPPLEGRTDEKRRNR